MNRILLFCAVTFSVLMSGCTIRAMSLYKGDFEAPAYHNFVGVGKNLQENSGISNITLSGVYVPDRSMRIHGLYNEPEDCDSEAKDCYFTKSRIKFRYNLDRFPVMASYTHLYKWQKIIAGVGVGVSKYLQGRFIFGMNDKNYEFGAYGDIGYGFGEGKYSYKQRAYDLFGDEYGEYRYSDKYIGHFVSAFGGYASLYYGSFGVTYSPALYAPWRTRELPISESYEDFDTFFDFPKIISQYIGLSVWITDHWKFTSGATFLTPVNMDQLVVTGNSSIGFWF